MKFQFLKAAFLGVTLLGCSFSYAGLISADLTTTGDGLLIEDTTTGLQWADWSMHPGNMSVNDFFISSLWANKGFRLATSTEIAQLFIGAGADAISYNGSWIYTEANKAAVLAVNATTLHQAPFWSDTNGNSWIHSFFDNGGISSHSGFVRFNSNSGVIDIYSTGEYSNAAAYDPQWSVMAVRETTVPEPSTLAIFALALMGLASRKFKKS